MTTAEPTDSPRFVVRPKGRFFVLVDDETGASWQYFDEATADAARDRAEADPRHLRRYTANPPPIA